MKQLSRTAIAARAGWLLIAFLVAPTAFACDMAPGFKNAQASRPNAAQRDLLPGPRIYLETVRRGFAAGSTVPCAAFGVINLIIDPRDVSPTDVYSFELVDGSFPRGALPDGFVQPVELDSGQTGFSLFWSDLLPGATQLQPVAANLRINRMSYAGNRSEPMLLRIESPGGPVVSPALALGNSTGTVVWIAAAVLLLLFVGVRMKAFRYPSRRRDQLAEIQARLRSLADDAREDN